LGQDAYTKECLCLLQHSVSLLKKDDDPVMFEQAIDKTKDCLASKKSFGR